MLRHNGPILIGTEKWKLDGFFFHSAHPARR